MFNQFTGSTIHPNYTYLHYIYVYILFVMPPLSNFSVSNNRLCSTNLQDLPSYETIGGLCESRGNRDRGVKVENSDDIVA